MKRLPKIAFTTVSFLVLVSLGYEVALHESSSRMRPTVEKIGNKIQWSEPAYAQNFDRGFADLVKRVIPGVVNISTYTHPHPQPGYGYGQNPQDELFRRFFEEFFGGRLPPPRGGQAEPPNGGDEDDGEGPQAAPGPHAKSIPVALGTGFIIDANEGLILTNNHVVQGAEEVKIQFKEEETELVPAEIIGRDAEIDVALLKVKTKVKLTAIPLGDSDAIDVGEYVLAIGNPLGYGHTVSHGILSAKGRRNPEFRMGRFLQTDASINPGNSGGPLINMKGEVVGINNAIDARAQGIGFAIPTNLIKSVLGQLKSKGSGSRAFLGVSAADLTPEIAEQMNISSKVKGVIVSDVQPAGPADQAGVKLYDIITAVNGDAILTSADLTVKIASSTIGKAIKLDILRGGKPKTISVTLTERPNALVSHRRGGREAPKGPNFDDYGFRVANTNHDGTKSVVVTDVAYGSPAADSGLNRGDFILDVAGKEIHSTAELDKAFKSVKGNSILIRVRRIDQSGNEFISVVVLSR